MERKSPMVFSALALAAGPLALSGPPAAPAAAAPGQSTAPACFRLSQVESTRPDGDQRIYARVNGRDVYRLDLESQCSALRAHQGLVLDPVGGNDVICNALDLDVAARNPDGVGATPCFLKSITRLTPAEVAALPPKARP